MMVRPRGAMKPAVFSPLVPCSVSMSAPALMVCSVSSVMPAALHGELTLARTAV